MTGSTSPVPVTVVVCTRNEALNIGACLSTLGWASRIWVVDAESSDQTVEIARSMGAGVVVHPWSGYSDQKNWAIDNLDTGSDWILFLDADERVTPDLAAELRSVLEAPSCDGYAIPRRLVFLGRLLKHAWWYPDYAIRLVRKGHGRFEDRSVHETLLVTGSVGYLRNPLLHDDQRPIADYVARLNRYSTLEAWEMTNRAGSSRRLQGRWLGSWNERRRALKERLWYRMPGRPIIRALWMLFIRRGLLDGREGRIFIGLAVLNEWLADAKMYELTASRTTGRPIPADIPRSHEAPPESS